MSPESLEDIKARIKKLEASEHPDFAAIAELHERIDALSANAGDYDKGSAMELDTFDEWASESSERYDDPDAYGQGQSFNSAETEPAAVVPPSQPKVETNVANEQADNNGLSDDMQKVMVYLVKSVVTKAYESATFRGKKKLPEIVKAAAKSGGPSPLGKISFNVKRGFEKAFGQLNYSEAEKHQIIYHLVLELEDNIYDIEHQDIGASRILKSIIAQEHLPGKLYKKLDSKGAFNK